MNLAGRVRNVGYYALTEEKRNIVEHLIYPIPDPDLPFLAVHVTRMIGWYSDGRTERGTRLEEGGLR